MNKKLLSDLAVTGGIYDCICDPYDKLKNGDSYSSVMIDLERFAEKIVIECLQVINQPNGVGDDDVIKISNDVKQYFGVEDV
jgi:hypothetical protein